MGRPRRHPIAPRFLALVIAVVAGAAACNATGATARPTSMSIPAAAGTASAGKTSGPTAFATTTFAVPFSLTLPTGWNVFEEKPDMFAAYLSTDHQTADVAVDIQLVRAVNVDPCNKSAGTASGGTTAPELASWMLAYAPLNGTAGAPAAIAGSKALVVDEAFAATPCVNAELWPTSGGWLDASERKRYFVFEMGGKRFVATIVSTDAKFDVEVDAGLAVLRTLRLGG